MGKEKMKDIRRILTLLTLAVPLLASAQTFTTSAPSRVAVGEPFRVEYTLNSSNGDKFDCVIPDEFDLLGGPSVSRSSSYQNINGRSSSSSSTTWTYVLSAKKNGNVALPVATVFVNGKGMRAQAKMIAVGGSAPAKPTSTSREIPPPVPQPKGHQLTANELYIRAVPSKTRLYEQEPVTVTYYLYMRYGVSDIQGFRPAKKPEFKGFWTQDIPLPSEPQVKFETIGGAHFAVITIHKVLAYPQQTGALVIPGMQAECQLTLPANSMDFDDLFNGGGGYTRTASCTDQTIEVTPLPQPRPAGFSGGVGHFTATGAVTTPGQLTTNDVAVYRITISGSGNLNLIAAPKVNFPKNFDVFEPKMTDESHTEASGVSGSVSFDYTFVPREQGEFTIPATQFTYFDTGSYSYNTITIPEQKLVIAKGTRSDEELAEEMALRNADISDIHEDAGEDNDFNWTLYAALLAALIVIAAVTLPLAEKHAERKGDASHARKKKALRTAEKRLAEARKTKDTRQFHAQVSAAMCGYVADQLDCPVTSVSAQTIEEILYERQIDTETVTQMKTLLDDCEFAQFAPTDAEASQQVLKTAENLLKTLKL